MEGLQKVTCDIGINDGIIRIICKDKVKTLFVTATSFDDKVVSLYDCLEYINYDKISKKKDDIVIVIMEDIIEGHIFKYNEYGDHTWWHTGYTYGYA